MADSDTRVGAGTAFRDPAGDRGHHSVTEPLWEEEGRPRMGPIGPVRVRVPAKINLHLGVGPLRHDGYHELATVYHAISIYDEITARPGRHAGADHGRVRAPASWRWTSSNLVIRAVRALAAAHGRRAARPAAPAQADPARRRAGRWQRRRGRRAGRLRRAVGHRAVPRRAGRHRRRARLRRAVPGTRRHRAGHRPGRGGQPGAGPRARLALGGRGRRRRPVHPEVYRELDRLRRFGAAAAPAAPPTGCSPRCGSVTRRVLAAYARQRPAGGRAVAAPGAAPDPRGRGWPPARSPASSPVPGRPVVVPVPRDASARRGCRPARRRPASVPRGRDVAHGPVARVARTVCQATQHGSSGGRWRTSSTWTRSARATAPSGRCSPTSRSASTTPTGSAWSGSTAPASPPCCGCSPRPRSPTTGRVTHRRDLRVLCAAAGAGPGRRPPPCATWCVGDAWLPAAFAAEHEWAGDAGVRTVLTGLGMPRPRPGRAGRADVRWRAAPGGAGRAAGPRRRTCWSSTSRPTTSTSPASTGWPGTCSAARGALVVVTHDRWFLDAVCDHDLGGRRRHGPRVRGRLRRLDPGPGRAGTGRGGHRGPPAEPAAQGDRLAAPRPAGPDHASRSSGSTRPTR